MQKERAVEPMLTSIEQNEIDIGMLISLVWRGKWIVLSVTILGAILSVAIATRLPDIYRAEALLAPASNEDGGGLAGLSAQYSGLASLAGINLGGLGGSADKTALGIEIMQSRKFIGQFVERHDILVPLLASNDWELANNKLVYDRVLYSEDSKSWVRDVSPPLELVPSLLEAHKEFSDLLSVARDTESGFVKVTLEHYSPYIAKQWVDWLVQDINAELRQQDISEAENSIAYLQQQLKATSLSELQAIFYQLIEEQTKTIMLANARSEYLFRTIDPAVVAENRSKPKRALICILGTTLSFLLGVAFVFFRTLLPSRVSV